MIALTSLVDVIQKFCPNGVEYKKFEDVCQYIRGITYNKAQEASSMLKRSTDSLKNAVENDLFSSTPSVDLIYAIADR